MPQHICYINSLVGHYMIEVLDEEEEENGEQLEKIGTFSFENSVLYIFYFPFFSSVIQYLLKYIRIWL